MVILRIKQAISTNKFFKILFFTFIIVVTIFYFKIFFTTGVHFDDAFLVKDVVNSDNHYIGRSQYGGIHITVKGLRNVTGSVDVIYRLPNNINRKYTVNFKDAGNWDLGIRNIKDRDGNIIFEGEYRKDSLFLLDKTGCPLIDEDNIIRVLVNGESPYNADYKVSLKNVADFANFADDTIRGRYEFLLLAMLLFVLTWIDIKFPLFFFSLKHFLDVRDPEPSDFYIYMQKISWYVLPVIGIVLMIVAIN